MIKRSTRGAARVSAVWMIAVGILFLAALMMAFVYHGDTTSVREQLTQARAECEQAKKDLTAQTAARREVTRVLGFFEAEDAEPTADLARANKALEDLRNAYSDLGPGDQTYQSIVETVITAYNARATEIGTLETRVQALEGELRSAQQAADEVGRNKDEELGKLRSELADATKSAEDRQGELQRRLDSAQSQLSDRDNELRSARADQAKALRAKDVELQALQTRISELSKATKFAREPFNQFPDGKIIETSERLALAWIDLGANQRLTRGMRFRVESGAGAGATRQVKAWAEVRAVEATRAEVVISGVVDPFDPVVAGDVIINPLYDPRGERNAVLVGRFSGTWSQADLVLLLKNMSITVQPELDLTTHFLIVGSELWNSPDTNEPLETPIQPSELSVYKEAEAQGVQIIPLQDVREFFRVQTEGSRSTL
jgi:hypothetical protein